MQLCYVGENTCFSRDGDAFKNALKQIIVIMFYVAKL